MNKFFSFIATGPVLMLTGVLSFLPAAAQVVNTPEPTKPPALSSIKILPPRLSLFSVLNAQDLSFEAKGELLCLTQPARFFVGDKAAREVLWQRELGEQPSKFTLRTTDAEEHIEDAHGNVVWLQSFQPSLTLDFDQPGRVLLLDDAGSELGEASFDNTVSDKKSSLSLPSPPILKTFYELKSVFPGIWESIDSEHQAVTLYTRSQVLWTGPRPANDGLRLGHSLGSPIIDLPAPQYPAGTSFRFEIRRETGSATVSDRNHHFLETVPTQTLRLTASTGDPKFRKSAQYYFLFNAPPATTQVSLTIPGLIYVRYQTARGAWAGEEMLHVLKETRISDAGRRHEVGLEFWAAYYDKTGKQIGTVQNGFRPIAL